MSGICGYRSLPRARRFRSSLLEKMLAAMVHRGPDSLATFPNGRMGLGHARLAVIDVPGGLQPFFSEDRRVSVVCDGRLYNSRELRAELRLQGHCVSTDADSEVLVHLWEEHGPAMLQKLRGMFALALIDSGTGTLFLARDAAGQKPLFFFEGKRGLAFASEMAALQEVPGLEREWDAVAVDQCLSTGDVPGPRTLLRDVQQLPPGHCLLQRNGHAEIRAWDEPGQATAGDQELSRQKVEETFERVVGEHLVSDLPVVMLLDDSPGSQFVLAVAAGVSRKPLLTCSVNCKSQAEVASRLAQMAAQLGGEHTEIRMGPAELRQLMEESARVVSQPLTDSAVLPLLCLARERRQRQKVILTGEGGGLLFSGSQQEDHDVVPHRASRVVAVRHVVSGEREFEAAGNPGSIYTLEQLQAIDGPVSKADRPDPQVPGSLLRIDSGHELSGNVLSRGNQATMAYGFETRTPLLDARLLASLGSAPPPHSVPLTKQVRRELAGVVQRWLPEKGDTSSNADQMPLANWFREELRDWVQERLGDSHSPLASRVKATRVRAILEEHNSGQCDHARRIYSLLALDLWSRNHVA